MWQSRSGGERGTLTDTPLIFTGKANSPDFDLEQGVGCGPKPSDWSCEKRGAQTASQNRLGLCPGSRERVRGAAKGPAQGKWFFRGLVQASQAAGRVWLLSNMTREKEEDIPLGSLNRLISLSKNLSLKPTFKELLY